MQKGRCTVSSKLEYHSRVHSLKSATVAGFALILTLLWVVPIRATAQVHGTPASVTSLGFGGRFDTTPGVPASVTSLGPNGLHPKNPFFNEPKCCINPLFPINSNPTFVQHRHHHNRGAFFGGAAPFYSVPYTPVIMVPSEAEEPAEADQDEDLGGPTIFDRRGPGTYARRDPYAERSHDYEHSAQPFSTPAEQSTPDQPQTVLVFKDGKQTEVQNYAVVGSTLYDLTPGHYRKIALADLDLTATAKQNDDRGIDFKVPRTDME
jgi:hypothetical protein